MPPTLRHPFALFALLTTLNASAQWQRIEELPASDTPALLVHQGVLYAGTDSTVWRSADGVGWVRGATLPQPGHFVDALFHDGTTLFAGTGGNGLFVSPIDGITWQYFSQGLTGLGSLHIADVAVFDNDLWCATMGAGVFRRSAGTWASFGGLGGNTTANVAFVRAVAGSLWAGAGGNGYLWRLAPGATAFAPVSVGPLQVDPFVLTDLIAIDGDLLAGSTYGLYRSTDGGATWAPVDGGPPGGERVRFLQVGGTLLALVSGTTSRIHRSDDQGLTWQLVDQMTTTYAIAHEGGRLYAGRVDGLWYRDDLALSVDAPADAPTLHCHPNPATDRVEVVFPGSGACSWVLHDMQGRTVLAGTGLAPQLRIHLGPVQAGTYLLSVEAEGRSATQRIVVQ